MLRRATIFMLWLGIVLVALAGGILAWPRLQDTYAGAVLSGRCDDEPKPDACRKGRFRTVPNFSLR